MIEQQPTQTLKEKLASWGVDFRIPHVHVNKLLSILKSHPCHSDLPVDARTFLKTPRKVTLITPGENFHFDLVNGLKGIIGNNLLPANHDTVEIEIFINVDGLPILKKSTSKQLWVILGMIRGIPSLENVPFIIGIYYGFEKPTGGPNKFLRSLVNDLSDLFQNRFVHYDQLFTVKGVIFVCDSPARAFVSGVKYHSGYSSCSKYHSRNYCI